MIWGRKELYKKTQIKICAFRDTKTLEEANK